MDFSKLSKKLTTTVGGMAVTGGMAWEVFELIIKGEVDIKLGLAVLAIAIIGTALQQAVYVFSQGRVDLQKEASKVDFQKAIALAADLMAKKNLSSSDSPASLRAEAEE